MKPYWTSADGNLTIYHGDARDVLPDLDLSGIDLVLTDPPYGIDGGRGTDSPRSRQGELCRPWLGRYDKLRSLSVHLCDCRMYRQGSAGITDAGAGEYDGLSATG